MELNKSRLVLLVALLFAVLGASIFRTPPILFMAAVLCAAPLSAAAIGRWSGRFLRVSREFPAVGSVGDELTGRVTLENAGPWPIFLLHCGFAPENKLQKTQPGLELVSGDEHIEPILSSRRSVVWEEKWRLLRRGTQQLPAVWAGSIDPLGFQARLKARAASQQIVVLPKPLKLARLGWTGDSWAGQRPPLQAARVAEASDFHGVRAHRPGEGMRRVHWKSTARTGQLHIVEWEEEMAHDLTLLLDVEAKIHAGEPGDDSLEMMVSVAASVAAFLLQNGHHFGLMWLENPLQSDSTAESQLRRVEAHNLGDLEAVLRALAHLQTCKAPKSGLEHLISQAAPHLAGENGLLLVTTERADLGAAWSMMEVVAPSHNHSKSRSGQNIVIDAHSFAVAASEPNATVGHPENSKPPSPAHKSAPDLTSQAARRLKRGDSLVAFLERGG